MNRPGRLSLYDTTLGILEEPDNGGKHGLPDGYEKDFDKSVLAPIRKHLVRRGWTVERDPRGKDYKCIAKWMWQANHGDLRAKIDLRGRTIDIKFYQDVVYDNPNGGQYDYGQFAKMPYLIRLRFLAEVTALTRHLTEKHGYPLPQLAGDESWPLPLRIAETARYGHKTLPTQDPLKSFNDTWDGEYERRRGEHRFQRDETGWPTRSEIGNSYYIEPGSVRYWVNRNGYVLRGRVYPDMNSMCIFVYGPGARDYTMVSSGYLSAGLPSLRKVKHHGAESKLKKLLADAVVAQDFERAIILRDQAKRLAKAA